MTKLRTYLQQISPALSLSYIEREAGIPENTLRPFVRGERTLATYHVGSVVRVLTKLFGRIKIDDIWLWADENIELYYWRHELKGVQTQESGQGFIYLESQHRGTMDIFALNDFLNK